jgi:hypothetical protein
MSSSNLIIDGKSPLKKSLDNRVIMIYTYHVAEQSGAEMKMFASSTTLYPDSMHDAAMVALELAKNPLAINKELADEAMRVLIYYFQARVPRPSCKACGK